MANKKIYIMDTTLRDGEQTSGLAYSEHEKLVIAKALLLEAKVDAIEVASARVSDGEFAAVKRICEWAKKTNFLDKIEVLGFVDNGLSVDWIRDSGCKVMNLLCKGSLNHLKHQLKKTPEQHVQNVNETIAYAKKQGIKTHLYLEDFSNGIINSPDYVHFLLDNLIGVKRIMLPDTLGTFNPEETYKYCRSVVDKYSQYQFDFHPHNDYGLAVANCIAAANAGINRLHVTVNGLGERAGNARLANVIAVVHDHTNRKTGVQEIKLNVISRLVESVSGMRLMPNTPIVGENVYTQTCGVHADGDSKGNLYFNKLLPERFGGQRNYALGKTSGKASIKKNLELLGIEIDDSAMKKALQRVIELSEKKEKVTLSDLRYIVFDIIGAPIEEKVKLLDYGVSIKLNENPKASVKLEIEGKKYQAAAEGDGQYDAFMKAVRKIYEQLSQKLPALVDYSVTIPPGGKTDALVETFITWDSKKGPFKTRGVDSDQVQAAIEATLNMLNQHIH